MTKYILSLLIVSGIAGASAAPIKEDEALAKLMNSLFVEKPKQNKTPEPYANRYRRLTDIPEFNTNPRLTDSLHPQWLLKAGSYVIKDGKIYKQVAKK